MKETSIDLSRRPWRTDEEVDRTAPPAEPAARIEIVDLRGAKAVARALVRLERLAEGEVLEAEVAPEVAGAIEAAAAREGHALLGRRVRGKAVLLWVRRGASTWA